MKLSRPKYRKSRLISVMILVSYPLVVSACTTQLALYILYLASLPTASYLAAEYLFARAPLSPGLRCSKQRCVRKRLGHAALWKRGGAPLRAPTHDSNAEDRSPSANDGREHTRLVGLASKD